MVKRLCALVLVFVLLVQGVLAYPVTGMLDAAQIASKATGFLDAVLSIVKYIFNMEFFGNAVSQSTKTGIITRFSLFLVVFFLVLELTERVFRMTPRTARVLGLAVALLSSFTIDPNTMVMIGGVYGTLFAILLVGVPIFGLLALVYIIPTTTRPYVALKFLLVVLIFWLVTAQTDLASNKNVPVTEAPSASGLGSSVSATTMVVAPILYYNPSTGQFYQQDEAT